MDETPCQSARRKRKIIMMHKKETTKYEAIVRKRGTSVSSLSDENQTPNGLQQQSHIFNVKGTNRVPLLTLCNGKSFYVSVFIFIVFKFRLCNAN